MVIADTLILLTYTVLGAVLCLLLLMVVQYQYGSVGNLLNRWTMREFRHIPKVSKNISSAEEALEETLVPVRSESHSQTPSSQSSVEPMHEMLQMRPISHSSSAKTAISATTLSSQSQQSTPQHSSIIPARIRQKNTGQNPVIQKMKQLYGVAS